MLQLISAITKCNSFIFVLAYKDEIPLTCTLDPSLNTCSEIVYFLEYRLGIDNNCVCNIEWKKFTKNKFHPTSCDPATPGKIKDTCKISCYVGKVNTGATEASTVTSTIGK